MSRILTAQTQRLVGPPLSCPPFILNVSFSTNCKIWDFCPFLPRSGTERSLQRPLQSPILNGLKIERQKQGHKSATSSEHAPYDMSTGLTFKKSIFPPSHLWSWGPQTTVYRCRHGCQTLQQPGRYHSGQTQGTSPKTEKNTEEWESEAHTGQSLENWEMAAKIKDQTQCKKNAWLFFTCSVLQGNPQTGCVGINFICSLSSYFQLTFC